MGVPVVLLLFLAAAVAGREPEPTQLSEPTFAFASTCELEVARFYCAVAPHDSFCRKRTLLKCLRLKDECSGFEATACDASEKCCACAFDECPLEEEGCELISSQCFGDDGERPEPRAQSLFNSYNELARLSGAVPQGTVPIKINTCVGGFECFDSLMAEEVEPSPPSPRGARRALATTVATGSF